MDDYADVRARNDVILSAEAAQVHKNGLRNTEDLYSAKFTNLIERGQKIATSQLQDALDST